MLELAHLRVLNGLHTAYEDYAEVYPRFLALADILLEWAGDAND